MGYVGGMFADHYFGGGDFGVGIDARWMQHPLWGHDSLFFRNGYMATPLIQCRKGNGGTQERADGMEIEVSPERKDELMALLFGR